MSTRAPDGVCGLTLTWAPIGPRCGLRKGRTPSLGPAVGRWARSRVGGGRGSRQGGARASPRPPVAGDRRGLAPSSVRVRSRSRNAGMARRKSSLRCPRVRRGGYESVSTGSGPLQSVCNHYGSRQAAAELASELYCTLEHNNVATNRAINHRSKFRDHAVKLTSL